MRQKIVTGYAAMWPRAVFNIIEGNKIAPSVREALKDPGVYILYRDDHPYYIGKTGISLFKRILRHANRPRDRYYNFWNYFSAFVVPDTAHLGDVEGILIAAMPLSANGANPRIRRINLPARVGLLLQSTQRIKVPKVDVGLD